VTSTEQPRPGARAPTPGPARAQACKFIEEHLAIKTDTLGKAVLVNCAKTALASKIVDSESDFFARMVVDAVQAHCPRRAPQRAPRRGPRAGWRARPASGLVSLSRLVQRSRKNAACIGAILAELPAEHCEGAAEAAAAPGGRRALVG
jgi:hypothetical protein